MAKVNIGLLRDNVSRYVRRASQGETIVVMNRGNAVATLAPIRVAGARGKKLLGCMRGSARVDLDIAETTLPGAWFRT